MKCVCTSAAHIVHCLVQIGAHAQRELCIAGLTNAFQHSHPELVQEIPATAVRSLVNMHESAYCTGPLQRWLPTPALPTNVLPLLTVFDWSRLQSVHVCGLGVH